jgi:hypothetical protein
VTREGKTREWWTSMDGLRWGGEKPRESERTPCARGIWVKLWSGVKPEEGHLACNKVGCPRSKTARWILNHEAGAAKPVSC